MSNVGRIWVQAGKTITVRLRKLEDPPAPHKATLVVFVRDPEGTVLASERLTDHAGPPLSVKATQRGWHQISVHSEISPALAIPRPLAYTLAVTYTAPAQSTPAELR
jgi:hypothetical protein